MLLSIVLLLWLQPTFSMNEEISYTLSLADVEEYLISNPKDFQDFLDSLNTSLNSTESVQSNPTTTPSLIPNTYKQPEKIYTIKNTDEITDLVKSNAKPGDIVLFMGAGTSSSWAYKLPKDLERTYA